MGDGMGIRDVSHLLFARCKLGVPALIGLTFDLLVIAPCTLFYILTQTDTINLIASTPKLIGFIVPAGYQ